MPVWYLTVNLADLFEEWRRDQGPVPELAEKVAQRVEESRWLDWAPYPDTIRDHLGQLRQADCLEHFNAAMYLLYDVADADRVWIEAT